MEFWVITTILCFIGWMLTLYVYSKTFKKVVDAGAGKVKEKAQNISDKDKV